MSEMVERVARAIAEKQMCDFCQPGKDGTLPVDCCGYDYARAAIAAMREPTEAMREAGGDASDTEIGSHEDARNIWRAMIDAALEHPR